MKKKIIVSGEESTTATKCISESPKILLLPGFQGWNNCRLIGKEEKAQSFCLKDEFQKTERNPYKEIWNFEQTWF